jgi:protein O-GlcNAc transferase
MELKQAIELRRAGRLAEAESACRRILAAQPFSAEVAHFLGMVLLERGQAAEAAELMRRSVAFAPAVPLFRVNLAGALGRLGRCEEGLPHLTQALVLGGGAMPALHNQMGATLQSLGRLNEAVAAFQNAIRLRPNYPEPHHNLGQALPKLGRLTESAEAYRKAVSLRPAYSKAAFQLAGVLGELGSGDEVVEALDTVIRLHPRAPAPRSARLYTMHYCPQHDAQTLYREHTEWGRLFCDPLRQHFKPHENDCDPDRQLRVGYVSPALREHTVTKFISAAIEHHDRKQFEVFCYSDAEKADAVTARIKDWADVWRDTRGQSDEAMDRLIRSDRIDILVDLRGHAADNRLTLFARKPAPVQINMVGYFNTTGLAAMDYRLTDAHMDPMGAAEQLNCEKLIRLEESCWCYSPEPDAPDVTEPPCIKNGFVTFGSLNKVVKISEPCAKLWAAVLEAVPSSRLLLSASGDAAPAVRERLGAMGLPVERLILVDKTRTSREYLERFNQIDIALDTFPFNGITTTCDGLWMGVPCVSLAGQTSVSRAGKSILHACGLGAMAADTPGLFVDIAAGLAKDMTRARDLRLEMRRRLLTSALLDHRRFAAKLESAYREMWHSNVTQFP